jgi:flagellar hook capping protein FlgD
VASLTIAAVSILIPASPSHATDSANWRTLAGGGGPASSGGAYVLGGTIGQSVAGLLGGGSYTLGEGYWVAIGGAYLMGVDGSRPDNAPATFQLHAPSPNPASGRAVLVNFDLPEPRNVTLRVFDITGRLVGTLAQGRFPAGHFQRSWKATERAGRSVAAGVYFLDLDVETVRLRQKVVVVR